MAGNRKLLRAKLNPPPSAVSHTDLNLMNSDLHNPALVSQEQLGPNHKLLSTDDLDKPLPEGAEYWHSIKQSWETSNWNGLRGSLNVTYRIPLTLSDRLRSERDGLDELIPIMEAVENGAEWEVKGNTAAIEWRDWSAPDKPLEWFLSPDRPVKWQVRLKPIPPTPRSIPWTLETHPDVVCVKRKTDDGKEPVLHPCITNWGKENVFIQSYGWVPYEQLHSDWLQRSGEPAGQKVTV